MLLRRILNFGAKLGLCAPTNIYTLHFEMPKLNKDQLASLFHVFENDSNRMTANMMLLALYTGMRKGEIYKLKLERRLRSCIYPS